MSSNHSIPAIDYARESDTGSTRAGSRYQFWDSVLQGESVAVRRLRSQIQRIAPYFRTALIRGELGSGKQLVARAIHDLSPNCDGPFIVAQAAVLAESMASGEGTRQVPAVAASLLQSAHGGTLYIEGVAELSHALQTAFFRFLCGGEDRRAAPEIAGRACYDGPERRGASLPTTAVRILAASDRDLRTLSAIGQFRQDLYARLSAVEIVVPPLRQRTQDIPALAQWLLRRLADEHGQSPKLLAASTVARLQEGLWPNNLRDLERVVAQAAALAEGAVIEPRHLLALVDPTTAHSSVPVSAKSERLHDIMLQHVLAVLTRCGGNKLRAAELLGISRSTLYRMLDAESSSAATQ